MKTKDFISKIENCDIAFLYHKRELFQYLLSDAIDQNELRIGIVVSIEISDDFLPILKFKRLELDKSLGNLLSLDELDGKIPPICRYFDMNTKTEIPPADMVVEDKLLQINFKENRLEKDQKFHKSLFMINQLKLIKEFASEEIIFSAAYINYMKSEFHSNINTDLTPNQDTKINDKFWFTLKVEGNFVASTIYRLSEEDGAHLPIIEVGSPCPPIWHDGIKPG